MNNSENIKSYEDLLYSNINKRRNGNRKKIKKLVHNSVWPENLFLMVLGDGVEINGINIPINELVTREENLAALEFLLSTLSIRERTVITCRYEKKLSLYETGLEIGVSSERTRQIENRTISKMQQYPYSYWLTYGSGFIKKDSRDEIRDGSLSIESLELSTRAYNCLRRAGIRTIGEIYNYIDFDNYTDPFINLRHIRNLGKHTLNELLYKLNFFFNIDDGGATKVLEREIKKKYSQDQIRELRELVYLEFMQDPSPEIRAAIAKRGFGLNVLINDINPVVREEAKRQIEKLNFLAK